MQTIQFELQATDSITIHGTHWVPDGDVSGVIQVFHGLGEHRGRYQRFAAHATSHGYAVCAHDHRGHGAGAEQLGHFADSNGWELLINDGLQVHEYLRGEYPQHPLSLLGHSMGSYIAQYFAMLHGDRLSALILSASTWPSLLRLVPGRLLATLESWRLGPRNCSPLLDQLSFGNFNNRFKPTRTEFDWLSRDEGEVDAYINDPLCGAASSCRLWLDLLGGLSFIASDAALLRVPSALPILITGGAEDPAGGDRGLSQLAVHFAQTMHGRLKLKIYPGGRHEMLNETNRDEFLNDLISWVKANVRSYAVGSCDLAGNQVGK